MGSKDKSFYEWGWYGDHFIITQTDAEGNAKSQFILPRDVAERLLEKKKSS